MQLKERITEAIEKLKPRLEDLADGHVDLVAVDEERGTGYRAGETHRRNGLLRGTERGPQFVGRKAPDGGGP